MISYDRGCELSESKDEGKDEAFLAVSSAIRRSGVWKWCSRERDEMKSKFPFRGCRASLAKSVRLPSRVNMPRTGNHCGMLSIF